MISPQTARRLVAGRCSVLDAVTVPIGDALGCVLAEDVRAAAPLPGFDNSAMDGYAVRARDTNGATGGRWVSLEVVATVFAGDEAARPLRAGEACRIMTGAALPPGADAVVPKEEAVVEGATLRLGRSVERYRHVRRRGEEVRRGMRVLKRGVVIHPGTIGCLATLGRAEVRVVRKPVVSVIATGDETVPPGNDLSPGQIYDSNSYMIAAMLRHMGIEPIRVRRIKDRPSALAGAVDAALERSDVLITIGGVSVGERDFLRPVLRDRGVRTVFWRVRQKPGKPIYFGVKGKRLVFGLPGNPASAFTCFYVYVYPALRRLSGFRHAELERRTLCAAEEITSDPRRWMLLKGKTRSKPKDSVSRLRGQGSHMATALAETDSLIVVPARAGRIARGGPVSVYRLPHSEEKDA